MTPKGRVVVAALNIFLLLSIHPINAKRITAVVVQASSAVEAMEDLEQAMHEDLREAAMREDRSGVTDVGMNSSSSASSEKNVCGEKWLVVSWNDGQPINPRSGAYRLESWNGAELFQKVDRKGCVKVYTAMCAKGGVNVSETCDGKATKSKLRSLTGWIHSRNSDIHRGEKITLILPPKDARHGKIGSVHMTSGEVDFQKADPDHATESCELKMSKFEEQVGQVRDKLTAGAPRGEKRMSFVDATRMVLRTRKAVKLLNAAKKDACDWVLQKSVDKTPLQEIVQHTAASNPCFEKARETLLSTQGGTAEEQQTAFRRAMEQLMSKTCELQHDKVLNIERLDKQVDLGAQDLVDLVVENAKEKHGAASLVQVEERTFAMLTSEDRLGDALGEVIAKVIGFIFLIILWALFCWVIMAILMAVLGLILCSLKSLIVFLVNVFKKNKWENDWSGCMGWWLEALGHSGGDNIGISLCAAEMMTGMM